MDEDALYSLSRRGVALATKPPMAEYIQEHFHRAGTSSDPSTDPAAYIALCIAENKLMHDVLLPRLESVVPPPDSVLGYDAMIGAERFREQLAGFLDRHVLHRRFRPDQLAVVAGVGSVLETVFYALGDPGDGVLVPTPSYAGFWPDLETRDQLELIEVPCPSATGFALTPELLEAALQSATVPIKALLFTNPDNPLGRVASRDDVAAILDWAAGHDLHVVCDEIYALSVFGDTPFRSAAAVAETLGPRVHVTWGMSKDFGMSGLRCGAVVSENQALLAAVDGLAYWSAVSGHTQWLLGDLLADEDWSDRYVASLQRRLGSVYRQVTDALDAAGIGFVPAEGGIFVLCDFRPDLDAPTAAAEWALWRRFLDQGHVNLTPGAACRIQEPGFMRLCYAAEPTGAVLTGIERLAALRRA